MRRDPLAGIKEGDAFEGKVTVEAVYHRSAEGWMACQCSDNHRGKFGVTGNLGEDVSEGSFVKLEGVWRNHARFGKQVVVTHCTLLKSDDKAGFVKVLTRICKVPQSTAEVIWHHYGESSHEACLDLDMLLAIPAMDAFVARTIVTSMTERMQKERKAVVLSEMMTMGASGASARRAFEDFGELAYDLLSVHPFTYGIIYGGLSFEAAQVLSAKSPDRPEKAEVRRLAARWELRSAAGSLGHVFLPKQELVEAIAGRVPGVRFSEAEQVIDGMVSDGILIREGDNVYDRDLQEAEWVIGSNLVARREGYLDIPSLKTDARSAVDIELTDEQLDAVDAVMQNAVSVITGGPGTGKTTVCRGIIEAFASVGRSVALCSPTGRGAKRLAQVTAREASTIHRLFRFQPSTETWEFGVLQPVEFADALLVDETSMVDVQLARAIFDAWPAGKRIIFVGDYDQLPSVGPGRFLKDMVEFGGPISVSRLTRVFRHGGRSGIALAAAAIKEGRLPELISLEDEGVVEGGFSWLEQESAEDVLAVMPRILEALADEFDVDPDGVQLIVPTNVGPLGTKVFNAMLRDHFNPSRARKSELQGMDGEVYRAGDKVMQIRNDYNKEVYNGDVGRVKGVKNGLLLVEFEGSVEPFDVSYHPREFEDLNLAYASSVHKAQGSEFDAGVFVMHESGGRMLQRNLLYTAISRFRRGVVGIGTTSALLRAVENDKEERRNTSLKDRMESIMNRLGG